MASSPKKLKSSLVNWNLQLNRERHNTKDFEDELFIVRRGELILLGVPALEKITFSLASTESNGHVRAMKPKKAVTEVSLTPEKPKQSGWLLEVKDSQVGIIPAANCIVGRWVAKVYVQGIGSEESEVIILFNPWCVNDQVFLAGVPERNEYILADTGLVFGAASWHLKPEGWGWVFGQFDSKVLDCVLYLLDSCNLSTSAKSSPVLVARAMSAMVNSQDDDGVLEGNWSGDYSGGADPSEWASSADILLQYLETNEPVKYGQCWVFSGVLVAVMRALGIPCRSVTNYRSAHDTELNMVIDIFHDKKGRKIESDDSVWNFHLWNEIWTKRPDLPLGNDGWQALDATPQEMSDGFFQTGPAPLNAIKSGSVYLPYDARFIFAEVNADRIFWYENDEGDYEIKKIDRTHVGRMVVTKAIGSNDPEYITQLYKFKEGSQDERKQTRLAVTFGTEPDIYEHSEKENEIEMKFHCDYDYIVIGEPIHFSLGMKLKNMQSASITLSATASIYSYNGKFLGSVGSQIHKLKLPEQGHFEGSFTPEQYAKHADFRSFLKISIMYDMDETRDMDFLEEEIPLRAPPPEIEVVSPAPYHVHQPIQLQFTYVNRFVTTLTNGYFKLNAPGFSSRKQLSIGKDLPCKESVSFTMEYTPRRSGDVNMVVSFSSDQHKGLQGYKSINVQ